MMVFIQNRTLVLANHVEKTARDALQRINVPLVLRVNFYKMANVLINVMIIITKQKCTIIRRYVNVVIQSVFPAMVVQCSSVPVAFQATKLMMESVSANVRLAITIIALLHRHVKSATVNVKPVTVVPRRNVSPALQVKYCKDSTSSALNVLTVVVTGTEIHKRIAAHV